MRFFVLAGALSLCVFVDISCAALFSFCRGCSSFDVEVEIWEEINLNAMIKRTIEYLADELVVAADLDEGDVTVDRLAALQEGSHKGILVSVINIYKESTLKNAANHFVHDQKVYHQKAPLTLNLDVVLVFDFDDYGTSLQHMSSIANFLHKKVYFSAGNQSLDNPFPAGLQKLIVDFQDLNLEQLNHVWSMNGGVHYPALFYKIRLVQLTQDEPIEGDEIKHIELDTENYKSPVKLKEALNHKQQNQL